MREELPEDSKIVELIKSSKTTGCRLLVNKYYGFFAKKAEESGLIKDDIISIVNDTFMKVIDNIDSFKFKNDNSFFNWIYAIFRNTLLDNNRKVKQQLQFEYFNESNFEHDELDKLDKTEQAVIKKIKEDFDTFGIKEDKRKDIIVEVINGFTENDQIIFWGYINSYKLEEISIYSKTPIKNLKVKLLRLRKKFIENLAKHILIDKKETYEKIKELH